MAAMARLASGSQLGPEFNDFLFAPIGQAENGMPLSVLSAMARLDVDPWQEAAELAQLSRNAAAVRLATLIAELPNGPLPHQEPGVIATRLLTLLPRVRSSPVSPRAMQYGASDTVGSRGTIYAYVVLMVILLGAQFILTSGQPPVHVGNVHPPASSTAFTKTSPRISGH